MALYPEVAIAFLTWANAFRFPALFRDAMIMCLGPYHAPTYHRISDPKLRALASTLYASLTTLISELEDPIVRAINDASDEYDEVSMPVDEIKAADKEVREQLLNFDKMAPPPDRVGGVSKPGYVFGMSKMATPEYPYFLKCVLGPLLVSELTSYQGAKVGVGRYKHHFLCTRIEDEMLPWWGKTEVETEG